MICTSDVKRLFKNALAMELIGTDNAEIVLLN